VCDYCVCMTKSLFFVRFVLLFILFRLRALTVEIHEIEDRVREAAAAAATSTTPSKKTN
jgi:hypothetical protein